MRPPLFEVTAAAADAEARRLTKVAAVKAAMRETSSAYDTEIGNCIDRVSASSAAYCKLARAIGVSPPTFGAETLRATWFADHACYYRDVDQLVLPWRAPLIGITSVVEDGVTLMEGTHYELMDGGLLQRLNSDTSAPKRWSGGKIVVVYDAGWDLPDDVPTELEGPVIEQVKLVFRSGPRDPGIRSETVPDVYQAAFNVAGGDAIGRSGLLVALEDALAPFKDWSQG
jgi:hypothetical protein